MDAERRGYFSHLRHDLVEAIRPARPRSALDVGCADGSTGALVKRRYPDCRVTGVEVSPVEAARARERLDRVFCGTIEAFEREFEPSEFDLILLGDVLEHLADPWAALATMVRWIEPGGVLVTTIPNVRNWRVLRDLALFGRWDYAPEGIMDRTHLRFFTAASARQLVEGAGLVTDRFKMVVPRRAAMVDAATFGAFKGLLAQKFLIRARRPLPGQGGQ